MIRTAVTQNGKVRGLPADDPRVTVFRGIPFAKPPVGKNRWRAPQPCDDWEGERKCFEFGPISMQDRPGVGDDIYCREFHVDPDIPNSEDSLYLNIWTGAKSTDEKNPVLVWIYGGAFQWGYTAEMEFNGERLARHGVVVVSIAYRLGVFGFLAHPDLTDEDGTHPTNFGLLDQKAGLEWVYENIAAFGGDPDNITIAGQSAGGASVTYALANPSSRDIIKKACVFSGFIRNPFEDDMLIKPRTIEHTEDNGKSFIEYLGCSSVEEARAIDALTIRDAYAVYVKDHPRFVPCIDGEYIKEDVFGMIKQGTFPDIPLFAGYTKDEFIYSLPASAEEIKADIIERGGVRSINIIQNTVREVENAHVRCNYKAPMYAYKFSPSIPGYDHPGDFHSCDLWFFFETIQKCWRPYSGEHYALARKMCDYWTNFIKTGDPNGKGYDGECLPLWNKVSAIDAYEQEMVFTER